MKKSNTYSTILLLVGLLMSSLQQGHSQCQAYVPMAEGSSWTITNYNQKDKVQSITKYALEDVNIADDGTTFSIGVGYEDKDGEVQYSSTVLAECKDGQFYIGADYLLDIDGMKSLSEVEADIDAGQLMYPDISAKEGDKLPDAVLTADVYVPWPMTMKLEVYDREVLGYETITTPAGTYDCIVISQRMKTKFVIGVMFDVKLWMAKGIGTVKSESYKTNGKLLGYSLLTELSAG